MAEKILIKRIIPNSLDKRSGIESKKYTIVDSKTESDPEKLDISKDEWSRKNTQETITTAPIP